MKYKLLAQTPAGRSFALAAEMGEDVLTALERLCARENIFAAHLCGIGGFARATLGYYDMESKRYEPIAVNEQVEVVSFLGNVTTYHEKPRLHVHCIVSHRDGHTAAGHLLAAVVRPTLELLLDEHLVWMRRTDQPGVGIPLMDL